MTLLQSLTEVISLASLVAGESLLNSSSCWFFKVLALNMSVAQLKIFQDKVERCLEPCSTSDGQHVHVGPRFNACVVENHITEI